MLDASSPDSAMKRYGLPSLSFSAPWRTDGAFQNDLSASRACRFISPLLVDLGDDDVPAAHRHERQYRQRHLGDDVAALPQRLEAVRIVDELGVRSALAAAGAAGGAGAAGCAAAGGVDSGLAAGVAGCPCACAANGTTAGAAASSRAAASMARRVIFSMLSPGIVVFSRKFSVWPGSRVQCSVLRASTCLTRESVLWCCPGPGV